MAATITVPMMVGNGMSASAALFGAGVGTLVYQLFTKFRSPVFLGSSFAFIGPMQAAFSSAYGFIAVSGLKMIQKVDLEDNANLFTVAAILIPGIGAWPCPSRRLFTSRLSPAR